jgi:hypothetical protein
MPEPPRDAPPSCSFPVYELKVIRRNGAVVGFDPSKISISMTKAFLAVSGGQGAASARIRERVARLTLAVSEAPARRQPGGGSFQIEDIQDQVELALMRAGEHEAARACLLYRELRAAECLRQKQEAGQPAIHVLDGGVRQPLDRAALRNFYDDVPAEELRKAAILAARTLIEGDPGYCRVGARLLLHWVRHEVLGEKVSQAQMAQRTAAHRPHSGRAAQTLRDRLRDRCEMAGRGGRPAAEMDRPGAVAQYLYGGRFGQEARRTLQACVAARPEDHLLPAHPGRHHAEKSTGRGGGSSLLRPRRPGLRGLPMSEVSAGKAVPMLRQAKAKRRPRPHPRDRQAPREEVAC